MGGWTPRLNMCSMTRSIGSRSSRARATQKPKVSERTQHQNRKIVTQLTGSVPAAVAGPAVPHCAYRGSMAKTATVHPSPQLTQPQCLCPNFVCPCEEGGSAPLPSETCTLSWPWCWRIECSSPHICVWIRALSASTELNTAVVHAQQHTQQHTKQHTKQQRAQQAR